jgi:putative lipoic acid-binding regulatory protein
MLKTESTMMKSYISFNLLQIVCLLLTLEKASSSFFNLIDGIKLTSRIRCRNVDGDEIIPSQSNSAPFADRSSDLTDRFKYKVNALMGVFDPENGVDNERQDGNILNAMLQFPTEFTFTAVGRTNGEDELMKLYTKQVEDIIRNQSNNESSLQCQSAPRGNAFTRVSVKVEIESSALINTIYEELDKLEMTVFKY